MLCSRSRSCLRFLLACGLLLLLAPGAARAEFAIGRFSTGFSDPARGGRFVGVELYYPATADGSGTPVAEPPPGGFPIVVFGHGYQMVVEAYENVWEALVPEGYVVALPTTEGGLLPSHANFAADLFFVVAELRTWSITPGNAFEGALSLRAAVMGHSMGGGAAVLAAAADASIDAVAVLAPAETSPSAIAAAPGIQAPLLVLAGSDDCVTPPSQHAIPMYQDATASSCRALATLDGGRHCQFGINNVICNLGEIFCGGGGISRDAQHALVDALLVPWLGAVLRQDWQAWQGWQDQLDFGTGFVAQEACTTVPAPAPACANGLDDDGDGQVDHPADADCTAPDDLSEVPDCEDGLDNDGDGLFDYDDPGCNLSQRQREDPQCSNGVDDDGDGATDHPADALCQGAWDDDEAADPPPVCGLLGPEALLGLVLVRVLRRRRSAAPVGLPAV